MRFRSPLLAQSLVYFLFLRVLRCFSSPGLPPPCGGFRAFSTEGCPIRTPADHALFAGPRSFSQLTTSFFASESLGIPHTPLFTSLSRFTYVLVARYTLAYLTTLLLDYSFLLFLQYVNELFASASHASFMERLVPYGRTTSDNVISSPRSAVDGRLLPCLFTFSIFQSRRPRSVDFFLVYDPGFSIYPFVIPLWRISDSNR